MGWWWGGGGAEQVLAMLKGGGGHNKFSDTFNTGARSHSDGGGDAKSFCPLKGGRKKFYPLFPVINDHSLIHIYLNVKKTKLLVVGSRAKPKRLEPMPTHQVI